MSKVQMLRCLFNQRRTAAAEEIFGLFERTIAEYEEELNRLKEQNERQQKLLDAVFNPEVRIQRARLEEADVKFSFTPVKSEDDEEEAQSSQLHQRQTEEMETEADGEDCGGPEPDRNLDPERHQGPDTGDKTGESSDTDNSDDWKETREPQSGLNSLKPDDVLVSDSRCSAGKKLFRCSECEKTFAESGTLKRHKRIHTGDKPFSCSVCNKSFADGTNLKTHMRSHTGEKPFSCSVCETSFAGNQNLKLHMKTHTRKNPR